MTTLAETIGHNLRYARESKRMTQQDVADQLGVTRSAYANIELGRNTAGVDHLVKLTRILGQPIHVFLNLPAPPPEEPTISDIESKIDDIYELLTYERGPADQGRSVLGELLAICHQLPADVVKQVVDFAAYQLNRTKNSPAG